MSGILAPFPATPIQRLDSFCGRNELYMKRDDLLPFCFGGNKARIAAELVRDMLEKKATCMVAYGSTRSNLSRALACACSSLGVRCVVVSPSEQGGARPRSFNSTMVERLGAQVVPCDRGAVRETVASTLARLRSDGERPYYIYGDETGHGNERVPVAAYEKVGAEISRQEAEMGFRFDAVYLATGTGMTQAGLVCWNEGLGGGVSQESRRHFRRPAGRGRASRRARTRPGVPRARAGEPSRSAGRLPARRLRASGRAGARHHRVTVRQRGGPLGRDVRREGLRRHAQASRDHTCRGPKGALRPHRRRATVLR